MSWPEPPDPKIPPSKRYVRIEEPLALPMERHAEFLGKHSAEHVVARKLGFVFRKDADFKLWPTQHRHPARKRSSTAKKPGNPGCPLTAQQRASKGKGQDEAGL